LEEKKGVGWVTMNRENRKKQVGGRRWEPFFLSGVFHVSPHLLSAKSNISITGARRRVILSQ
jgi:hypothetical protein